jgi:hypothetical protein
MRKLAGSAYFLVCLGFGRLLRSARYSRTRVVEEDGELRVRKRRSFYAPLLVRLGGWLVEVLDTGVRVLPQRDWEQQERLIYQRVCGTSIRIDADGTLVLPYLAGETLAILLEKPELETSARKRAIELAVVALANFHARGFTHGDAMAENVMIDLGAGVAHWFDFESAHDSIRPMAWRRADDVRALLATCLIRTARADLADTLHLILNIYGDEEVSSLIVRSFSSPMQRPLAFHLGQAGLSLPYFNEIGGELSKRIY